MAKPSFLETSVKPRCAKGMDPKQALIDCYADLQSLHKVAVLFACSPSTISRNLERARLEGYTASNGRDRSR